MKSEVGPYRLLKPLGEGGMGIVWRAEHKITKQQVALKTVRVEDHRFLRSIRREIQSLAGLRHPGIVSILEDGVEDGLPWYAMPLLEGQELSEWCNALDPRGVYTRANTNEEPATLNHRAQTLSDSAQITQQYPSTLPTSPAPLLLTDLSPPLPEQKLLTILTVMRRVCETLSFLHGEGVIHQDLKPENVLVRSDDTPVLLDFGISIRPMQAKLSRENLVIEHDVIGTAYYISPEQLQGETSDARADLYALGVILFELLTNRRLFVGTVPQILDAHVSQTPPKVSELVEGIPALLDDLVSRLLSKKRQDRPGYAQDVAMELGKLGALGWPGLVPSAKTYLYRPYMIGRGEPLLQLTKCVERVEAERGGLVLLGGESGVGKTRLATEFARYFVHSYDRVLSGECQDQNKAQLSVFCKPLQAIADICREKGRDFSDLVFGRRGKVLALYEPSISKLPGQEQYPEPVELPMKDALQRLFSYLAETLSVYAAGEPLLLILDDLQWADSLSLAFLQYFLRSGAYARWVLILGTYRLEEVPVGLEAFLRDERVERLSLGRLEGADISRMIGDMLALSEPPSSLCAQVSKNSEGNPFFVAEYIKTAVEEMLLWRDAQGQWRVSEQDPNDERLVLPDSLRELVARRLERLPAELSSFLSVAALVGREIPAALLEELSDDATQGPRLLRELIQRQLLEETEEALRFVHDKLREVAQERLHKRDKPWLHRRIAQAIEKIFGADAASYQAELGRHWELGGDPEGAKKFYLSAARYAEKRYNLQEAEWLYRRYLSLVDTPDEESMKARNELGEKVLAVRGKMEEANSEHRIAVLEASALGLSLLEAQGLRLQGAIYWKTGKPTEARKILIRSLALSRGVGDRREEAYTLESLAVLFREQGQMKEARALYEEVLALSRTIGDRALEGHCVGNFANLNQEQGNTEEARPLYERALALHRKVGNRRSEGVCLNNLAELCRVQGRIQEAQRLLLQALEIHREVGNRRVEGITLENLAGSYRAIGQMDEAKALYEQALLIHQEVGNRRAEGIALGNFAIVYQEQGEMKQARALYERSLLIHREVGNKRFEAWCLGELAIQERWERGDIEAAEALCAKAESMMAEIDDALELAKLLCLRGHILLWRGESAEALLEKVNDTASSFGASEESELGKKRGTLARAQEAFTKGEHQRLFRGQCLEDIPIPIRNFLIESSQP